MKKLLFILPLLLLFSCSSAQVNKIKLGGAKMLGEGVASFIDKQYQKMGTSVYTEMNCSLEASSVGNDVRLYIEDKLGAKPESGFMSRSITGEIARVACGKIASELLPNIIVKNISKFPCFAKMASDEAQGYIEKELCNSIEF